MIEIVQAGQAGKTSLLFDMHRLRARVFKDMMKWDVTVNSAGLEVDQFDLPEAVYLLALNKDQNVIGSWRLLPASGPTMIRDVWPQYLESLPMPATDEAWEASRFAIHSPEPDIRERTEQAQQALGEMFCALTEFCIHSGIKEIYTLYDRRIARIIKRIDCQPYRMSEKIPIDGIDCQIGVFQTNEAMLQKIRIATGIGHSLLGEINLPMMGADKNGFGKVTHVR